MRQRKARTPPTSPPAFLDLEPADAPAYDAATGAAAPVSITSSTVTITMDAHDALMLQRAADAAMWTLAQREAFNARYAAVGTTGAPDPRVPSHSVAHACSRIAIALSTARDAARDAARPKPARGQK